MSSAPRGGAALGPGTNVDRYSIEALIGRGGMGEVYRAVDSRLRRKVALKVLRGSSDDSQDKSGEGAARLFREARAAAALTHPNTVAIHDLGESDGLFYIVMELVSGKPLLAYVGDERVSMPRRLKWLTEIARALATAHRAGVIHRDVKPSNVMVSDEDVAKVLDFGLAKPLPKPNEPESFGFKTQAGRVLGTVRYMSPEQLIGSEADGRSDQYALGLTAFELIAGKYPPGKPYETPPLLDSLVTDFPADGAKTVARMLKRLPDDRFPSMDDVVSAFEDLSANRPVRALTSVAIKTEPMRTTREDPSVVETAQEPKVGSTLQSAPEDFSADTQAAIEEALQPTMTANELAKLKAAGTPAATLMSNDGGDAAKKARDEALSEVDRRKQMASTAKMDDAPPLPAQSGQKAVSTLQSADAGDKIAKVRAATAKMARPVPVEVVEIPAQALRDKRSEPAPAPPPVADEGLPSTKDAPPPAPATKPKRSNTTTIVLALAFAVIAAFSGWYFGQRSRGAKP